MPDEPAEDVTMVPVRRYDINLSLDQILAPLADIASRQASLAQGPERARLEPHLSRLSELASQMQEVVRQINEIHPALLRPGGERPAGN